MRGIDSMLTAPPGAGMQADPDREKAGRAQQAMLTMHKIVIADLEAAYAG